MSRVLSGLAGALLLASLPAQAVTINFQPGGNQLVSFNKGTGTFTPNANVKIFENFDAIGKGYTSIVGPAGVLKAPTNPLIIGANPAATTAANRTVSGRIYDVAETISGTAARPRVPTLPAGGLLSTGNFGAIASGGQYVINFSDYFGKPINVFSFALGSVDGTGANSSAGGNRVTLYFADGTTRAFTGAQLTDGVADGNQSANATNGRVTFDTRGTHKGGIAGAVFSSDRTAFEFDNFAGAAPEPATWGMLILGFGFAGYGLRRGRRLAAA
jgi:hypothetical protein